MTAAAHTTAFTVASPTGSSTSSGTRIAIYARVRASRDDQLDDVRLNLQIQACMDYSRRHHLAGTVEIHTTTDHHDRPDALTELLTSVGQGKYTHVLVRDHSRLSRRADTMTDIWHTLRRASCQLLTATGPHPQAQNFPQGLVTAVMAQEANWHRCPQLRAGGGD